MGSGKMKETIEMICITCPLGCPLTIEKDGDQIEVSGNTCPRGKQYAINELTDPKRMITTTVVIHGAIHHQLPVITSKPISKALIFDVMKELKQVEVNAPIEINDVIVENVLDSGVDIIASRTMNLSE